MANEVQSYPVGAVLVFNGYDQAPEGEPILTKGERVRVTQVRDDQSLVVVAIDAEGKDVAVGEDLKADAVFPEECTLISLPETQPAAAAKSKAEKAKEKAEKPAKAAKSKAKKTEEQPPLTDEQATAALNLTAPEPQGAAPVVGVSTPTEAPVGDGLVVSVADSAGVAAILQEQDALDAAKNLIAKVEEGYFTLGGVLHHIYQNGTYKSAGYDGKRGFANYVQAELGIDYRKAMYLIGIYVKFRQAGVDETKLALLGWSKAAVLSRLPVDALRDNWDALVGFSGEHTRDELLTHVKTSFENATTGAAEQVQITKLNFRLAAADGQTVVQAIDAAKRIVGNDDPNAALAQICTEWLNLTEGVQAPVEEAIRALEQRYNIKLVAQPAEQGEGTQGLSNAEAAA